MTENLDREAIVKALKDEALHETGWLSDLHRQGLEWHDASEIIVIDDWFGSVDVGHLAEVVERLIAAAIEQAEQAVARVREVCTSPDSDLTQPDFDGPAVEYVLRALDGEPNE